MGLLMQTEPKRYFAAIRFGDDVRPDQLGRRVEGLRQLVSNLVKCDVQLAFSSGDERLMSAYYAPRASSNPAPAFNAFILEKRSDRWLIVSASAWRALNGSSGDPCSCLRLRTTKARAPSAISCCQLFAVTA